MSVQELVLSTAVSSLETQGRRGAGSEESWEGRRGHIETFTCVFMFCILCSENEESGGILKPFPVSRVPVTIEVQIKIKIVL